MQRAGFILGQRRGLGFRGKSTASGSQLVAAQSPAGEGLAGRLTMLLVGQGALGAPDAVVGATALRGGRGSHRHHGLPACRGDLGAGVEVRASRQGSPLPQRLRWAPPGGDGGDLSTHCGGLGYHAWCEVDVPERGGEQGPDEEGAKGDAQHSRQDEAFVCTTKDRMAAVSTAVSSCNFHPTPTLLCSQECRFGARLSSATDPDFSEPISSSSQWDHHTHTWHEVVLL